MVLISLVASPVLAPPSHYEVSLAHRDCILNIRAESDYLPRSIKHVEVKVSIKMYDLMVDLICSCRRCPFENGV